MPMAISIASALQASQVLSDSAQASTAAAWAGEPSGWSHLEPTLRSVRLAAFRSARTTPLTVVQ